jgi:REP element-mobilizing transposase RayT
MARSLRIEYPGACYHVINRGNRRIQVFFSDSDYELFLEKLGEYLELYEVDLFSYCLMPNHYHLFLITTHANLGKFMQAFNTSYTISMNRKYGESGHLFQGRYKAQLVESELYKNVLSRYIHLNPVKVKSLKNVLLPNLKKKLYYDNGAIH